MTELKLASVAYNRGNLPEMRAAIAAASAATDPDARYAPSINAALAEARGRADVIDGNYADAQRNLAEAARLLTKLPGDQREALGRVWMNEADAWGRLGRYDEADQLFAAAAAAYQAKFGRDHVSTAKAIQNRAFVDFELGRIAVAQQRMEQVLGIFSRVLEPNHPFVAASLLLTGRIRTANRQPDRALADLERAATIYRSLYGADAPAVGDVAFYAAEAEAAAGRTGAALAQVATAKTIYDKAYGAEDPDQVELSLLRARVLARGGRRDEAAVACRAAIALQQRIDPTPAALNPVLEQCRNMPR